MRLKALACEVLARQVYLAAAQSPHAVDVELLDKGLHDDAGTLRAELQRRLDGLPAGRYDAAVLVYGLCNRATEGLVARGAPLVLPRAHDCITLYLGSRERYSAEFEAHPGTYYYSAEWLERGSGPGASMPAGAPERDPPPDAGMAYGSRLPTDFEKLVRQYGEENARYLLEVYGSWRQHYTRAAFIAQPCARCPAAAACEHEAAYRERAATTAHEHGWELVELDGDPSLVRRLLDGAWAAPEGEADFAVVPPGSAVVATFDERVVAAGEWSGEGSGGG